MIALLGKNGYVANSFASAMEAQNIAYTGLSRGDTDYTQATPLKAWLDDTRPRFLINCAGYTGKPNVDACETDKANCLAGNAVLPGTIAEVCQELGIPWGHVSSGCIYSGKGPNGEGFREEDQPNFGFRTNHCSFYSGTKALGEEVLAGYDNVYIWRLRIPFNNIDNPRNYISKLVRYDTLLQAENSISELDEFANACLQTWQDGLPFGIYNLTNPGSIKTSEVVEMIRKRGLSKKEFRFFESEEDFMSKAAKTPRSNCVLNTDKMQSYGICMSEVHEALDKALRDWKPSET